MFQRVIGLANACGVEQGQGHTAQHQLALEQIAGGAGQIGDDRPLTLAQAVEQARFAHVGAADDRHSQPLAQQLTLLGLADQPLQLSAHAAQLRHHNGGIKGG